MNQHRLSTLFLAASLPLAACATAPLDPLARAEFNERNDPAEPVNRATYDANAYVDRNVLKPVARAYAENLPDGVRRGVHNVLDTLGQPVVAINDVLQGNPGRALTSTGRFVTNATAGGLGLFDVATGWGLPGHRADYGQTFGVWGIPSGPFVMLPLLGPSSARDAVGTAIGFVANPLSIAGGASAAATALSATSTAAGVVDGRARLLPVLDPVLDGALDPYGTVRSLSQQQRAALVKEGRAPDVFGNAAASNASDPAGSGNEIVVRPQRPLKP